MDEINREDEVHTKKESNISEDADGGIDFDSLDAELDRLLGE